MPGHIRRHTVHLTDRDVGVVERALLCYAVVMKIQTGSPSPREADDTAHTAAVITGHKNCKCPVPIEEGAPAR